ncbi:UDP-N-acetylmuramoyl-L-alanine--D-glutamate ligase [Rubrobacter indicoceani]|uniref:UDP-N-acetylmuramoyl-L-alanine--D-glutamate ligase n=1 Tax=Rubrobacter indicoceani TaxID=2051957 RepID=UPI0013C500E0|nr:UDP-N-acetylmuramoyl-L-alanine--D-glutamate ligase [Rubrobacter indicoceani]
MSPTNGRTLVYGLGESGISSIRALQAAGVETLAADSQDDESLRRVAAGLDFATTLGAGPEVLEGVERVVVSPGVRPSDAVLRAAGERGVPVLSEVAFGLELLGGDVRVSAVTGTNGKTTVADMTAGMLDAAGLPNVLAGNSWRALTGCADEVREAGRLVLEVSSFQLHYLPEPGFEAAALLNVRPDHLNWHASFDEYVRDKLTVFAGQKASDLALVSATDEVGRGAVPGLRARTVVVGEGETLVTGGGELVVRGERIVRAEELPFGGPHNLENALFAASGAVKLGAGIEAVREGLLAYGPKPHRIQVVERSSGITWVDDSKATNPAAVVAALLSFRGRSVVLILGGSEKKTDFAEVEPYLGGCRAVVCCGESGPRLFRWLEGIGFGERATLADELGDAVKAAKATARSGDVVLLSPGCASFDEFSGYAERGDVFARLARVGSV